MRLFYIFLFIILTVTISFSNKKPKQYNGFSLKSFENNLMHIPAGDLLTPDGKIKVEGAKNVWKEEYKLTKIDTFYMSNHEVCNFEYLEFLQELKIKDTGLYVKMLPDTMVWRDKLTYNEPYVEYYFRHPAYRNYPVVGISYEQAEYYCEWITEKYMKVPKRKFKNAEFKLPTINQWKYAAMGKIDNFRSFPWIYDDLQNPKGEWLANFMIVSQASITRDSIKTQNASNYDGIKESLILLSGYHSYTNQCFVTDVTAPVFSYSPNEYGIYNMAGNVEEFMIEKGVSKGGSWFDPGYYLQISTSEKYDINNSSSSERGFRYIMEIKK